MKKAPPAKKAERGFAGEGEPEHTARVGQLPLRKNTVVADVLAQLLDGRRITSLQSVFAASTTRLGAVVFYLSQRYGWDIDSEPLAVGCVDGRTATVAQYSLDRAQIAQAMAAGAGDWCAAVKTARDERRKQALEAERRAARINEARRRRPHHPGQGDFFGGDGLCAG